MTLELNFPAHTSERTIEGTLQVQSLHEQFSKGCKALMVFWQKPNGRLWLSNEDGRTFGLSSYLSARVHDLSKLGIPIEKMSDGQIKRFRLKCTCHIVSGQILTHGCWAHSPDLKVTI